MTQMNLSLKQTHRNKEQASGCQIGEAAESWIGSLELEDANYYIYIEWISNKVLLYSAGNYIQYLVISHMGENMKKRIAVPIYQKLTQHCKSRKIVCNIKHK